MRTRPLWFTGQFLWHWFVTMVRRSLGRWYVFRDRPDWFVLSAAAMTRWTTRPRDDKESDVGDWARLAKDEWRARRRQRQLAAAVRRG